MRIGYFTNQYPAVSHTFIRREIQALEALGVMVMRYALRPGENLVDGDDQSELKKTHFILGAGLGEIVRSCATILLTKPLASIHALLLAIKIGWRSDRGVLRHFAYLVEAAVLAHWCRRDSVQHLHAHFGTNPAVVVLLASRLSGLPFSFTAHGPDEFERAPYLALDVKLELASFVVCVSAFGRSQFMRWSKPDLWHKIVVVHCGLDSPFFNHQFLPPPSAPRLVCVGRLSEQKGQSVLVGAARRLRDEGVDCAIVLAGDGPMRDQLEGAIAHAGLQDRITITGWISGDRIKEEIAAARALVLPSFAENMPVVIMEALALGRPVISTYIAGIPELVQPERTGWLVPAGDEAALTAAMRDALGVSVEQLEAMGAAGRVHILEQHDSLKEATKLKKMFEEDALATSPSA